ncbi:MAG: 50S ribosomal protein L9 [Rickettsiales bacterium]|nr:50S ribosomal protein L9 [Rickettsiales bacterium]
MKIILIAAVSNLGKIGDVVEVKSGYGKNFLIPSKKAICFSANNHKIFEAKRQEFEKQNDSEFAVANKVKEQLAGKDIIIIENASDDGRLYGSVNSSSISAKINEVLKNKATSRANIFLKKPIKEIGIYEAGIALHSNVEIKARLIVTRSESEIEALLKAEKKSEKALEVGEKKSEKSEAKENNEINPQEALVEKSEKIKKPRKKKAE